MSTVVRLRWGTLWAAVELEFSSPSHTIYTGWHTPNKKKVLLLQTVMVLDATWTSAARIDLFGRCVVLQLCASAAEWA